MALAVLPVPCSLKQKAFLFSVKNEAVFFWCSKGVLPGQEYCPHIGDGTLIFNAFSMWLSFKPQSTMTLLSESSLLLEMYLVTRLGSRNRNNKLLLSIISTLFLPYFFFW
jgi:hypothetical protein